MTKPTKTETLRITTPSDCEVVMTRDFDAPRSLVFEAMTTPALINQWMGAPGRAMELCEMDLRVGGSYHFVWRGVGKKDVGMHGEYREIVQHHRVVRSELWEDWDAGELIVTEEWSELDGVTTLTITTIFPSKSIRDQLLKSGLERGARETYDKLEAVLMTA